MSPIAPILERNTGKIRFAVDDVKPAADRLPTVFARSQFEQVLTTTLLAFSHDETFETIADREIHPLALAVHAAFSEHRPLVLTPDIIWLTIAQGVAQHINNNAEELRANFVSHQGKDKLVAEIDILPTLPTQWAEIIEQWTLLLRERVGADVYRLMECNFSTTTSITHIASHVVMMDAFQQYFDYVVLCVCGIPEISLLGTVADWQSIYDRVASLSRYNLGWWTARLLPICQEFINTAAGKPDRDFWQCIYKPQAVYAVDYMTGWLTDLFPYLRDGITKAPTVRNHVLALDRCKLPTRDNEEDIIALFGVPADGIALTALPMGISQVGFKLVDRSADRSTTLDLELIAGFIGVHQDLQRILQPEIGWGVRDRTDGFSQLLERIQQEHLTQPPWDRSRCRSNSIPRELVQMLERFDGATIYRDRDRSWQILPARLWEEYWDYDESPRFCACGVTPFIDLSDGRSIAYNFNFRSQKCWFFLGNKEKRFASSTLIATSPIELFNRMLAADGAYYFDEPNFQPSIES
ncbi:DUF4419 domain-containing protein [Chamaesiphon polymorphus]|uniref:DUF4419 domain-containing protein n=1 Tax=Chamaesiphon polymorphus CCALA 037 TaxID=2107692 RepID=A0A2T1GC75_9CYAN|nr:DUF4419 domain-containing protein [Chamaesiphon polymorphus]PSB54975.1 hypothetical protein C7B77_16545 [Chamaesiphon polymorphus CCALA 037]